MLQLVGILVHKVVQLYLYPLIGQIKLILLNRSLYGKGDTGINIFTIFTCFNERELFSNSAICCSKHIYINKLNVFTNLVMLLMIRMTLSVTKVHNEAELELGIIPIKICNVL